jgi:hypothetical protein
LQLGDFTPGFDYTSGTHINALKLIVIITDHESGGFCDVGDNGSQAAIYANDARNNCVKINAIQVGNNSDATPIMLNYYQTSCGWYEKLPNDGAGIAIAVDQMLYVPGFCNCP